MKILSADQQREADAFTIKNEPVASIDLMERAAAKCVEWISYRYDSSYVVTVFCGLGNNGGDGLAISRLLLQQGYKLKTLVVAYSGNYSPDFEENLKRLSKIKEADVVKLKKPKDFIVVDEKKQIYIDAIFGSGLNKPIEGWLEELVKQINAISVLKIAIDIPSGLFADSTTLATVFQADHTLTFHTPKLSFMFPSSGTKVGIFHVLDIGLHPNIISSLETNYIYLDTNYVKQLLRTRKKFSHKGTYGHALIYAGSKGKVGAASLSVKACLRSGAGLVTARVPRCAYNIIQTLVPEAMVEADEEESHLSTLCMAVTPSVISVGPGVGTDQQTVGLLKLLIQETKTPMVLDADALNILADNKTWFAFLPRGTVLTPHPKEFLRMVGEELTPFELMQKQIELSKKYSVYIVLKGAHTAISTPEGNVYFNSTGNPGLAKGGSGDVLTGIITAFIAQGYTPLAACQLGVYLHGKAADIMKETFAEEAMLASDVIEGLGEAMQSLRAL